MGATRGGVPTPAGGPGRRPIRAVRPSPARPRPIPVAGPSRRQAAGSATPGYGSSPRRGRRRATASRGAAPARRRPVPAGGATGGGSGWATATVGARRAERQVPGPPATARRRTWPQRLILAVGGIIVGMSLLATSVAGYMLVKYQGIDRLDDLDVPRAATGQPENYLIVAVDTREGQESQLPTPSWWSASTPVRAGGAHLVQPGPHGHHRRHR